MLLANIGPILANSVVEFFSSEENKTLIKNLDNIGVNMEYIGQKNVDNVNFINKKFVVTGTLSNYGRDEVKNIIENNGGTTSDSVSKKTDVVIVGENAGSKYDKAIKLGIEIWDEETLQNKLNL